MDPFFDCGDIVTFHSELQGLIIELQSLGPIFDGRFELIQIAVLDIAPRVLGKVGDQTLQFLFSAIILPQRHIGVGNCPAHIVKGKRIFVWEESAKLPAKCNSLLEKCCLL